LHVRYDTLPGEVFLHLAADALGWCGASQENLVPLERLRERFLPECSFRGKVDTTVSEDYQRVKLSRLRPGERFVYVFDLGDDWAHLCTVGPQPIDPLETLGIVPGKPLPYFGWGDIPDQYGRRWDGDDGESSRWAIPSLTDLPALRPDWGPARTQPWLCRLGRRGHSHATSGA